MSAPTASSSSGSRSWAELLGSQTKPVATPPLKPVPSSDPIPSTDEAVRPPAVSATESYDEPANSSITVKIPTTEPSPAPTPAISASATTTVEAPKPVPALVPKQKLSWAAIAAPPKPVVQAKKISPAVPVPVSIPTLSAPVPVPTAEPIPEPESEPEPVPEPVVEAPVPTEEPAVIPESTPLQPPGLNKVSSPVITDSFETPAQGDVPTSPAGYTRQITQDVPVVLPSTIGGGRGRLGVQFGSLNLADDETTEEPQTVEETPVQSQQPQQDQSVQSMYQPNSVPQQQQPQGYNSYNRYNQRQPSTQYGQQQAQPQQAQSQQAQQAQQAQQPQQSQQPQQPQQQQQQQAQPQQPQLPQQQKPFDSFAQNQYVYPGSHPSHPGFNGFTMPTDYPYGGADPQRNSYGNYYNPYQQQSLPQDLSRSNGAIEQSNTGASSVSQQASRYGSEKAPGATGSAATSQSPASSTASPGIAAAGPQYQQPMNPYYVNPAYAAYYYQYGFNPQPQQYASPSQKNYFNQQSYYNTGAMDYRQTQPQPQQGQVQQQQQAGQQSQQQSSQSNTLSGISDFLQREDKAAPGSPQSLVGTQIAGQQLQQQGQPQGQPQYPAQQNLYSYAGYGNYGQGGRQNWNYGN